MSSDGNEWDLNKENVPPLRQRREMATLQEALAQPDVSTHTATQQQKRKFESEIRFYCGYDPLDVWDRYSKWTEQTFPPGGKDISFPDVLKRSLKALHKQQRYYQDPRYLSLWLKFANYSSREPLDVYSYLRSQEIGTSLAQLYITWAEELEMRRNYKKADLVFRDGLRCKAEPVDILLSHHRWFRARVPRQSLQDLEEDGDLEEELGLPASEPQGPPLAELQGRGKKTVTAPVSHVGNAVKFPNQGQRPSNPAPRQALTRPNFAVFDENTMAASRAELPALAAQPWAQEDPLHRVQSHQQDDQEEKEQPMYCKEKVYARVELSSFEEIRAQIYMKKARKQMEEELQALAQKKAELQREIEEMEKIVREQQAHNKQRVCAQGDLPGVEPPSEEAIVPGSYTNKTLCPNPENTCALASAAHIGSAPSHGMMEQRIQLDGKPQERGPESQTSLTHQTTDAAALCVKKPRSSGQQAI